MNIFRIFLGVLVFTLLLIFGLYLTGQPADAAGIPHNQYGQLLKGGTQQANIPIVKWLSYLFGLAIIGIFGIGIYIGMLKNGRTGPAARWIIIGFVIYGLIYTGMILSYWSYDPANPVYFGSFPAPTAWMIYGIWIFPFFFTFVYNFYFHTWYLTDEDMEKFEQLVQDNKNKGII